MLHWFGSLFLRFSADVAAFGLQCSAMLPSESACHNGHQIWMRFFSILVASWLPLAAHWLSQDCQNGSQNNVQKRPWLQLQLGVPFFSFLALTYPLFGSILLPFWCQVGAILGHLGARACTGWAGGVTRSVKNFFLIPPTKLSTRVLKPQRSFFSCPKPMPPTHFLKIR